MFRTGFVLYNPSGNGLILRENEPMLFRMVKENKSGYSASGFLGRERPRNPEAQVRGQIHSWGAAIRADPP